MSDDDSGHARSLAEQLRLAKENGKLPDELAEECEDEETEELNDVELARRRDSRRPKVTVPERDESIFGVFVLDLVENCGLVFRQCCDFLTDG